MTASQRQIKIMIIFYGKKKKGFTLIEIIIVVVILGILAAVALPKLTENIGKATAAEAFRMGGAVGAAFSRCLDNQSAGVTITSTHVAACDSFGDINMTTPPTTNFTYAYTVTATTTNTTLTAAAVGKNGLTATDIVTFTYNGTTGAVTKGCAGQAAFISMCK